MKLEKNSLNNKDLDKLLSGSLVFDSEKYEEIENKTESFTVTKEFNNQDIKEAIYDSSVAVNKELIFEVK
ncbi:hypothetical protein [Fictibacillus sp. BK138]|uniref:hypothetical protein n=1 Tax=Fictibacillus sp. BK138 TaxID=2512121 RepID=UPI0010297E36|nr:hypothetical protein [Fictibacillus sp. BK138]